MVIWIVKAKIIFTVYGNIKKQNFMLNKYKNINTKCIEALKVTMVDKYGPKSSLIGIQYFQNSVFHELGHQK